MWAWLSRAVMDMHHDEFGDYQMRNEIVGYEAGRRLVREPARVAASPEEQEAIGDPARYLRPPRCPALTCD